MVIAGKLKSWRVWLCASTSHLMQRSVIWRVSCRNPQKQPPFDFEPSSGLSNFACRQSRKLAFVAKGPSNLVSADLRQSATSHNYPEASSCSPWELTNLLLVLLPVWRQKKCGLGSQASRPSTAVLSLAALSKLEAHHHSNFLCGDLVLVQALSIFQLCALFAVALSCFWLSSSLLTTSPPCFVKSQGRARLRGPNWCT